MKRSIISPIAIAILALASSSLRAQSAPTTPEEQALLLAPIVERDVGLNAERYRDYLAKEAVAMRAQGQVKQATGEAIFGGFYMHRRADDTYENRALLTDSALADEVRELGADEVLIVKYSFARLLAAQKEIVRTVDLLQVTDSVHGVGINVRDNKITLEVAPDQPEVGQNVVAASGLPPDMVEYKTRNAKPYPTVNIWGGDAFDDNWPSAGGCTVGFSADLTNATGYITAGHCYQLWSPPNPAPVATTYGGTSYGQYWVTHFGNYGDHAWVLVTNSSYTPQSFVRWASSTQINVFGNRTALVGATVCKYGRTTAYQCGVVQSVNNSWYLGTPAAWIYGMTRTDACSEGGDSGGPNITSGGEAQGVTNSSGSAGPCTSTNETNYTPLTTSVAHMFAMGVGNGPILLTSFDQYRLTLGYQLGGSGKLARTHLTSPTGKLKLLVTSGGLVQLQEWGVPIANFLNVGSGGTFRWQFDGNLAAYTSAGSLVWNAAISVPSGEIRLADNGELHVYTTTNVLAARWCVVTGAAGAC